MQNVPGRTILSIGSVVQGRYIIENLLGVGGFGAVYLVKDEQVPHQLFALKEVIDPSKRERERFTFECEVLKRLSHPALPRVHDVFADERNNRAYMLMDYIEGPSLERVRQQQPGRRFTLSDVMTMMAPIVDVITYLHNQHPPIIHRDIKPANIIIPASGSGAVLVDFGIAKEYDPDATTTALRHCSPGYSAPEQYTHGTDARTDVYALGATFHTLLTGILPTDALHRLTHMASRGTDPLRFVTQLVPTLPLTVAEAIRQALALNSDDRFATIEEFWQAISASPSEVFPYASVIGSPRAAGQQPIVTPFVHLPAVATPRVSVYRQRRRRNSSRVYTLALSCVALAVLALLAGFAFRTSFWSTGGSFALSTPTAASRLECNATITSITGTTVTSPSLTDTPRSSCSKVLTTLTSEPTGTTPTPASIVTASTPEPTATTPTPVSTVIASTPEPTATTPTPVSTVTASTPEPTGTTPTPASTVTASALEPAMTAPTPGPTGTAPTPASTATIPTSESTVIALSPGSMTTTLTPRSMVVHPSPRATPTVPLSSSPMLTSASTVTSSPSGLIMSSQKSGNGEDHRKKHGADKKQGADKKHRVGKKHGDRKHGDSRRHPNKRRC